MARPKPTLPITSIVANRNQLAITVETHVSRYYRDRRKRRMIVKLQSKLQDLVDPEAWAIYSDLEDAAIQRESVVRWVYG